MKTGTGRAKAKKGKGQSSLPRTAKLFRNGRSQAVRLPAGFRFPCNEIFIRQDPITGDVILSRRPQSWESFFQLRSAATAPDDFLADQEDMPPQKRELF
jgi:antitoxin VapB